MSEESYDRPVPEPDEMTAGFWEQTLHDRLAIQRCQHCGTYAHPPVQFCRNCHNLDDPSFQFEPVSGRGVIVSWTVLHDQMVSGFETEPPWVNALVELEEQPGLEFLATLEDGPVPDLVLGAPVEVTFQHVTPHVSLPYFKLTLAKER